MEILLQKKIDIIPTLDELKFDKLVAKLNAIEKDPVQVDLYLKTHGLEQVEGLKDYILNNDIKQDSVNNLIQTQNYKNIANQAHGFTGVNAAIKEYNKLTDTASRTKLAETISTTNTSLGNYLTGLNGASAGMGSYASSLATATAKTFALQAATMAMNTAATMGISVLVTGAVSLIPYLVTKEDELAKKAKDLANNADFYIILKEYFYKYS